MPSPICPRTYPTGLIYAIKAFSTIASSGKANFLIVGDGPEKSHLEAYVKENGLETIITFYGNVPRTELFEFYNASDVFITPSVSGEGNIEGTPMAILEAMACGLPIVASAVGGIPQVVRNHENGLLHI